MNEKQIGHSSHSIRQTVESVGIDGSRNHEEDRFRFLLQGPISVKTEAYSSTIRDAAEARVLMAKEAINYGKTRLFARAFQKYDMAAQQGFGSKLGSMLPWHESWMPRDTTDNDRMVTVLDYRTGRAFGCWMVDQINLGAFWHIPNHLAGFNAQSPTHLAMASMVSPNQSVFTMRDYESGGAIGTHGAKISGLLGVVRAFELISGIKHAISISISRPAYGVPVPGKPGTFSEPVPHRKCGPTQLEHINPGTLALGGVTRVPHDLATVVASGHRMAIDIGDAALENVLSETFGSGPELAALKNTARIFAVALRDYGWIVLETNAYGIGVQTEGRHEPKAAAIFERAGLKTKIDDQQLNTFLQGLLQNFPWKTVNERNIERPPGKISKKLPPYVFT